MRVILVGPPGERDKLRARAPSSIEIVGEAPTTAAARALDVDADALLSATGEKFDEEDPDVEPLTARERDVLELLVEGLSNKSIAQRLAIGDQTVKFHVASICGKLGAANRTDAVRRGIRRGLVAL
jgi:two-component system, NarL family, nitrate/nitrite response regulator NarL